ncbi:MAG: branched-chain amino acid ABC transporter permease, partial [Microthrixaceae bacterium]
MWRSAAPALRIKGLYLALVTLAVATLFPQIIEQFSDTTGGSMGLPVTSGQFYRGKVRERSIKFEPPEWTGLAKDQWKYLYFLAIAVFCFVIVRNLVNSRTGRAMVAVRDNEVAAEVNGIDVARIKVLTFGASAAL